MTSMPSGGVPPFVLVHGPEAVLAERALASTLDALRSGAPDLEVIRLPAASYEPGALGLHTAPSLFGGAKAVVVEGAETGGDDLQADLLAYVAAPADDTTLVVLHEGGNRGKKVVDALKGAHARVLPAPAIKTDKDKADFVVHEFRARGRKVAPAAVRALVEAVGRDVRELAAACRQLVDDTTGLVDEELVDRYHGGRLDVSGFRVADAALAGNGAQALRLLRHALASGVDPVPIVAVLAAQLRQLVRVAGAGRAGSAQVAASLQLAPWQVDRARRTLSAWDVEALGRAIVAVAAADVDVKGGGRDPGYAVERAVLAIAAEHGR